MDKMKWGVLRVAGAEVGFGCMGREADAEVKYQALEVGPCSRQTFPGVTNTSRHRLSLRNKPGYPTLKASYRTKQGRISVNKGQVVCGITGTLPCQARAVSVVIRYLLS